MRIIMLRKNIVQYIFEMYILQISNYEMFILPICHYEILHKISDMKKNEIQYLLIVLPLFIT